MAGRSRLRSTRRVRQKTRHSLRLSEMMSQYRGVAGTLVYENVRRALQLPGHPVERCGIAMRDRTIPLIQQGVVAVRRKPRVQRIQLLVLAKTCGEICDGEPRIQVFRIENSRM